MKSETDLMGHRRATRSCQPLFEVPSALRVFEKHRGASVRRSEMGESLSLISLKVCFSETGRRFRTVLAIDIRLT